MFGDSNFFLIHHCCLITVFANVVKNIFQAFLFLAWRGQRAEGHCATAVRLNVNIIWNSDYTKERQIEKNSASDSMLFNQGDNINSACTCDEILRKKVTSTLSILST